jgi:hypothetical protein
VLRGIVELTLKAHGMTMEAAKEAKEAKAVDALRELLVAIEGVERGVIDFEEL